MEVFIGNLSPRTTMGDLVSFFKGFASGARFQIFDRAFQDGSRVRYAVASIASDELAQKVIRKLSGHYLKGNIVSLREYYHRSHNNERRDLERRRKAVAKMNSIDALLGLAVPGREEVNEPARNQGEARKP